MRTLVSPGETRLRGTLLSLPATAVVLGLAALVGTGEVAPVQAQPAGTDFYTIEPCRAVDTRETAEGPLRPGIVRLFMLDGCGVPLSAFAVAVNVTTVGSVGSVQISAFPGDGAPVTATAK